MRSLLFVSITIFAVTSCAADHLGSVQQSANLDFADMVTKKLGWGTGLTLLNYGCHCGPGNPDYTVWLDDVDFRCKMHDEAYLAAPKKFEGCNCNTQAYAYTVKEGVVTCAAQQVNQCAAHCCEADKTFVDTVAVAGPLVKEHTRVDRTTVCPLAECIVDEDCEPGLWCDRGTCVPYCGGGWGSAILSTACDSPGDEVIDTTEQLAAPDGSGSGEQLAAPDDSGSGVY